ncbi:hypothetical protein BTO04_13525 [Polaribacter sp. SA4-10]|uniref:sensor histidine kinase n=1 Tax=Polaribacter sp. SA4-10 TaxID=754397 RepID=UPI000B3CE180|nr:ATP-binding protein [Polaribacter sp. SA4-10]ARV07648.1 hypothetical protein BTO04_13525 [Polaribacter sp. SA4-10]
MINKLEDFEIKNASITCLILSPSIIIYSLLIFKLNPNAIEINWLREVMSILFLIVGLLPFTKNKSVINNYGWYTFGMLFIFSHYLIYTTYLNDFSLDYLLGTYVTVFGSILLFKDRFHILLFNASCLVDIFFRVSATEFIGYDGYAILISMTTIFIFSFIILNHSMRYKKALKKSNLELEEKVKIRTRDLEEKTEVLLKKNEELEEYAYVISHDLKSPIRNIYTVTHLLLVDYGEVFEEDVVSNLNLIKDLTNHMELLVNGILDYSLNGKIGLENEIINLNEMLINISKSNSDPKSKVILKNVFPIIEGVKFQVLQVFQNLIQNAFKYNNEETKKVYIDYKLEGDFYLFSIEDNGIGIEEKYFDKIFKLFKRLELSDEKESIGLGLSLVKKIINTMGGDVWLTSELNIGTTFYFTIPKQ